LPGMSAVNFAEFRRFGESYSQSDFALLMVPRK
jgi:hypothetical protein